MFKIRPAGYPTNVRFAQRLVDLGQTPEQYFSAGEDADAQSLARAVYVRFYKSEIGLEELDIFDLKAKDIFSRNKDVYVQLLAARRRILTSDGETSRVVRDKNSTFNYGNTVSESSDNQVYVDVSRGQVDRHHTGIDEDFHNETEKFISSGDPEYFAKLQQVTDDIHLKFTELFFSLFMEVLL